MDIVDKKNLETNEAPNPYLLNGSFSGHVLAGGFMFVFGLIWSFSFFYRYFTARTAGLQYRGRWRYWFLCQSRMTQKSTACVQNIPVESCLQVAMGCGQLSLELIQGYGAVYRDENSWIIIRVPVLMHMSMSLVFIICGLLDFAVYNPTCCTCLPKRLVYYTGAVTFGTAGLLFATHLHHGSSSNTGLHVPATLLFFVLVVVIVLESFYTTSVVLPCLRAFVLIVIGLQLMVFGYLIEKSETVPEETIARLANAGHVVLWLFLTVVVALVSMVLSGICARISLSGSGGTHVTYYKSVTEQLLDWDSS